MTINYKGLSYKLHEFLGEADLKEKLRNHYKKFFFRSKPLDFFSRSLSFSELQIEEYFEHLCSNCLIISAHQENRIVGFIAFDFKLKSLTIPQKYIKFINKLNQSNCCEFVFASSESNSLMELRFLVFQILQYIKQKYNKKFILGNFNRKHKKHKFKKVAERIFKFNILEEDFTFHEIP